MPVSSEKSKEQRLFETQLKDSLSELPDKKEKKNEPKEKKSLSRQISIVRSRSTSELLGDEKGSPRITRHTSRSQLGDYFGSEDEINNEDLSGKVVLHIKTDSKELIPRPRIRRASSVTETHFATQVFSKGSTIRLELHQSYSIWMIKVIIFDQFGGSDGFDPTSMALFTLPDKNELKNEGTLESYSIPTGSTLLALPTPKKGPIESGRRAPFASRIKAIPHLSFAIGRGLSYAIVNFPSTFKIFAVSKQEKYLTSFDEKYYIVIEYVNGKKREIADGPLDIGHVDKQGRVTVTYTPTKPGTYIISIQLKKQHICLSPFEVTAIEVDSTGSGLKEMAFSGWDIESASILANFSANPMKQDIIFSVGISVLLHLFGSPIESIQKDMTKVLTNLLQHEENKFRIATEGSIDLVKKIVKTSFWRNDVNICRYLCRMILFSLESNNQFGVNFLQLIGLDFCITMADSNDLETRRYSVKIISLLCHIPDLHDSIIENGLLMEVLLSILSSDDIVIQLNALSSLRHLIQNYNFLLSLNDRKVNLICGLIKSKERNLKITVLSILSDMQHQSLVNTYISGDIYLTIYNSLIHESLLLWWEYGIFKMHPKNFLSPMEEQENFFLSEQNFVALKFINNILAQSDRNQIVGITEHLCDFANGDVLLKVCKLAGAVELRIQVEACQLLTHICSHEQLRNKIIQRGWEVWITGSIRFINSDTHLFVFAAIAKLSASFCNNSRMIDETPTIKTLLRLAQVADPMIQRQCSIILGHLLRNERYRTGILTNGKDHLLNLMFQAAGSGELTVHESCDYNNITFEEEIAIGAGQTKVFKGKINGKIYAVKCFDPVHDISFNAFEFQREVFIMSLFQHKRIASCVCASTARPHLFIASKLYKKGSIAELIKNNVDLELPLLIEMLLDIAEGMCFLHSLNIVHRDIKPGNLLVSETFRVTIADFGTTRVAQKKMSATIGTAMYMAPDIINSENYTTKVDVYSFGVVVWEMIERKIPFPNLSQIEIVAAVVNGERPPISPGNPLSSLIKKCWSQNPNDRPTFEEISAELSELDKKSNSGFVPLAKERGSKIRRVHSLFGDQCKLEANLVNNQITNSKFFTNSNFNNNNFNNNNNNNNILLGSDNIMLNQSNIIIEENIQVKPTMTKSDNIIIIEESENANNNTPPINVNNNNIIVSTPTTEPIQRLPSKDAPTTTPHHSHSTPIKSGTVRKKSFLHGKNILKHDKGHGEFNSAPTGLTHTEKIKPKRKGSFTQVEQFAEGNNGETKEEITIPATKKHELSRATSIMKFPFQLMKNINQKKESKLVRNSSQVFDPAVTPPKKIPKRQKKSSKLEKADSSHHPLNFTPVSPLVTSFSSLNAVTTPNNSVPNSPTIDYETVGSSRKGKREKKTDEEKKERKHKKKDRTEGKEKRKKTENGSIKRSKRKTHETSDSSTTSPREDNLDVELNALLSASEEDFEMMSTKQTKNKVRSKTLELKDDLTQIIDYTDTEN